MDEMVERIRNLAIPAALIRNHVEENFSVEVMVKKYAALYQSILRESAVIPIEAIETTAIAEPGAAA